MKEQIVGYVDVTGEALRRYTPGDEYHTFRVLLLADRYDPDWGKFSRDVSAIGGSSAKQIALSLAEAEYPDACVLGVSQLCDDCHHPLIALGSSPGHGIGGCRHRSYDAKGNAIDFCDCDPLTETERRYQEGDR